MPVAKQPSAAKQAEPPGWSSHEGHHVKGVLGHIWWGSPGRGVLPAAATSSTHAAAFRGQQGGEPCRSARTTPPLLRTTPQPSSACGTRQPEPHRRKGGGHWGVYQGLQAKRRTSPVCLWVGFSAVGQRFAFSNLAGAQGSGLSVAGGSGFWALCLSVRLAALGSGLTWQVGFRPRAIGSQAFIATGVGHQRVWLSVEEALTHTERGRGQRGLEAVGGRGIGMRASGYRAGAGEAKHTEANDACPGECPGGVYGISHPGSHTHPMKLASLLPTGLRLNSPLSPRERKG
ncbi:hypothetical protein HaLaN_20531 [Haematococcus lacustris]|uniref:Uncharacterized protein n=1 Tax=Haematococcus lacustris TaxID=44745 RepID=A0A699ZJN6_HAELA|nr:hypothetical protein HaLaN_20531 [Haematococcus lacustris]